MLEQSKLQMESYQKVYDYLLALPEEQKQFAYGRYYDPNTKNRCVLGTLNHRLQNYDVISNCSIRRLYGILNTDLMIIFKDLKERFNLSIEDLVVFQNQNDSYDTCRYSPKQRFEKFMKWLKEYIDLSNQYISNYESHTSCEA